MIRIARNRIRYVAAIFQQDISKMEQVWATQDVAAAVADTNEALRALTIQQGEIANKIQLLIYSQPQNVR